MVSIALQVCLGLIAVVLLAATLLPLLETDRWWVRMLDFPRLQFLVAIVAVMVLLPLAARAPWVAATMAALGVAAVYHAVVLWPVTVRPALPREAASCNSETFSVLVANVRMGNRDADRLIEAVRRVQPDIFVAQETDEWWDERLSVLSDLLPHTEAAITGSYYGMHLFARHPLRDARVLYPTRPETPVIVADVALPTGPVHLVAIHPRPPHPWQSSVPRDAELLWAALQIDRDADVVVAGDLNAVPWEDTVERMRRLGGLLDPRQRMGFQPSYDAQSLWMKWPLDQILNTAGLRAMGAALLPDFGSDHYPYVVRFCPEPALADAPVPREGDRAAAEAAIEATR